MQEELSKFLAEALLHLGAHQRTRLDIGQTQMFVTVDQDIVAKSDKAFRPQMKNPHNLAKTVESNESAPNRHTKQ